MKDIVYMIASACRRARAAVALSMLLLAPAAPTPALAQLYPFFGSPPPIINEEPPPRFTSRRAVAAILAREGFRLVGPLGRRGEQIVATGVSRVEGEARFFIDPYEGRIIRLFPIDPGPEADGGPYDGGMIGEAPPPPAPSRAASATRRPPAPARAPARNTAQQAKQAQPVAPPPGNPPAATSAPTQAPVTAAKPATTKTPAGSTHRAIVPPATSAARPTEAPIVWKAPTQ